MIFSKCSVQLIKTCQNMGVKFNIFMAIALTLQLKYVNIYISTC